MVCVEAKYRLILRTFFYPIRALRYFSVMSTQVYPTYRVEWCRFFYDHPSGTVGKVPLHLPAPVRRLAQDY